MKNLCLTLVAILAIADFSPLLLAGTPEQKAIAIQQAKLGFQEAQIKALQATINSFKEEQNAKIAALEKIIRLNQLQSDAQIADLKRNVESNQVNADSRIKEVRDRTDVALSKVGFYDPTIGGDVNSFELIRSADNWCKSNGFSAGVANMQSGGSHRGVICFR